MRWSWAAVESQSKPGVGWTDRQETDRQAETDRDRQAGRQAGRQASRQTDRHQGGGNISFRCTILTERLSPVNELNITHYHGYMYYVCAYMCTIEAVQMAMYIHAHTAVHAHGTQ